MCLSGIDFRYLIKNSSDFLFIYILYILVNNNILRLYVILDISIHLTRSMTKEAILYEKRPNGKVLCTACARYCEMKEGQIGLCGIRGNENGKLDLYVYGKVIAGHVDPIEKKPDLTARLID